MEIEYGTIRVAKVKGQTQRQSRGMAQLRVKATVKQGLAQLSGEQCDFNV
jgi:hypothetical protein